MQAQNIAVVVDNAANQSFDGLAFLRGLEPGARSLRWIFSTLLASRKRPIGFTATIGVRSFLR